MQFLFQTIIGLWWRFFEWAPSVCCLLLQHRIDRRATVTPLPLRQHQFLAFHCYFGHLTAHSRKKIFFFLRLEERNWKQIYIFFLSSLSFHQVNRKKIFTHTKHTLNIHLRQKQICFSEYWTRHINENGKYIQHRHIWKRLIFASFLFKWTKINKMWMWILNARI